MADVSNVRIDEVKDIVEGLEALECMYYFRQMTPRPAMLISQLQPAS